MKKEITALAVSLTLISGILFPSVSFSSNGDYTVKTGNASYYLDEFNSSDIPKMSGSGNAGIVIDDNEHGRVLEITGEAEVKYTIPGSTVLWDGETVSDSFSGSGTENDPYLIKSGADLKLLQQNVNGGSTYSGKYFKLINNIDLQNNEWESIGNTNYSFSGVFDGGFNKVMNIKINKIYSGNPYVGFFGKVSGSIVNFGIENAEYVIENSTSDKVNNAGGLVAYLSGTVDNCFVRNIRIENTSATQSIAQVGGLVGTGYAGSLLQNSYVVDFRFTTAATNNQDKVGGLGGYLRTNSGKAYVYNCYVAGDYVPDSKLPNYYAVFAVEKNANTVSANNYSATGVATYKTNLTQVEVKYETVLASNMRNLASDLGAGFTEDATSLVNRGYPYHKNEASSIPDEVTIRFDVNSVTSDGISFDVNNTEGKTFFNETVALSSGSGWHNISVDLSEGRYVLYVDGNELKSVNTSEKVGHSEIIFKQNSDTSYRIDNILIVKDCTEEYTAVADEIMQKLCSAADLNKITRNLDLFEKYKEYSIVWTSSDEKIMTEQGEITRRALDLPVNVKAYVEGNSTAAIAKPFAEIEFTAIVAGSASSSDEDKLSDFFNYYLKESLLTDESSDNITKDLKALPSVYEDISVRWESNNESFIANDGKVTLPEIDESDKEVTLTATASLNGVSKSVNFEFVVKAPLSDMTKLQLAVDDLNYGKITAEEINSITQNLNLPKIGLHDTNITWDSDNKAVISDDGIVTRREKNIFVTLKATFELEGNEKTRSYYFNVLMSEEDCAREDAEAITLPSEVTDNFTLPTEGGIHSSRISWTSDKSEIEINGAAAKVTRPDNSKEDKNVKLTATATYGDAAYTKEFIVTVLKAESDNALVDSVYGEITWESISSEPINAVTDNLALSAEYKDGVSVSWICEPEGAVLENGTVIRPAAGESDMPIKLTANISKNAVIRSKEFEITLKAFADNEEALKKAADELVFSELASSPIDCLTEDLELPTEWRYGTSIIWSSSDESVITVSNADKKGYAHFPEFGAENDSVTVSAELSLGGAKREKRFYVTLAEPDGEVIDFFDDMEKYDLGALTSRDNITINKAYVATEIVNDPLDPENKVMRLYKDKTLQPSNQKGTQYRTIKEKKGLLVVTAKLNFESLSDRNFLIAGTFGTGEEVGVSFSKDTDGVRTGGKTFPYNEWLDVRIEIDTYALVYRVFVNGEFLKEYDFKYKTTKTAARSLAWIYFDFVYNSAVGEHAVYVDNFGITKEVSCKDNLTRAANMFETAFLSAQDLKSVTEDLIIPEISVNETTIETVSSDTRYLSDDGRVTRPEEKDVELRFTAIYKSNYGSFRKKDFDIIIKASGDGSGTSGEELNKKYVLEDVTAAVDHIYENHTVNRITGNLDLIPVGEHNSEITYSSSDKAVISDSGAVTRPSGSDKDVTLTVTAKRNGETEIRTVELIVLKVAGTNSGGSASGGGGSVRKSGGGGSTVLLGGGLASSSAADPADVKDNAGARTPFKDIENHWAKDYIEELYEKGVISGKSEDAFAPDDNINREEFVTLVVKAFGLELSSTESRFKDVGDDDWFAPYIMTACENKIANGISGDKFGVGFNISRQDMCVMVYNALKEPTVNEEEKFFDDGEIAGYAKAAVYCLKNMGIISGRGGNLFKPYGTATRAEAAKIISILMKNGE